MFGLVVGYVWARKVREIYRWCDAAAKNYKLLVGNKELEQEIKHLRSELNDTINGSLVVGTSRKIQKAEKERDQLMEENKKLEYCIADLLKDLKKEREVNKDNLQRMKEILDK